MSKSSKCKNSLRTPDRILKNDRHQYLRLKHQHSSVVLVRSQVRFKARSLAIFSPLFDVVSAVPPNN